MLQDIEPYHLFNEYRTLAPRSDDFAVVCAEGSVYVKKENGKIVLPSVGQFPALPAVYLFTIGGSGYYLLKDALKYLPQGYEKEPLRALRTARPRERAYGALVGSQLARWYEHRQFCGKCGKPMKPHEKERMMYCPQCRTAEYPKLCPAVIVAVVHGDHLLLTRYAGSQKGSYALVAGFAEIGETIEDTVRREVMEETGLRVRKLLYYKSQPWPFSESLLFGFFAELEGSDQIRLQEEELSEAVWFGRGEIPVTEDGVSLTNEMIMKFKNGMQLSFP